MGLKEGGGQLRNTSRPWQVKLQLVWRLKNHPQYLSRLKKVTSHLPSPGKSEEPVSAYISADSELVGPGATGQCGALHPVQENG